MNLKRPILIVQNNTGGTLPVNLFRPVPMPAGVINAPLQYKWDITSLIVNQLTDLQLQVGTPGTAGFSNIAMTIANSSVAAIVTALNGLNVGFFQSVVSGGSTFIITSNKAFTFGSLVINQPSQVPHWITTGGLQVNALGVTGNAGIQTNNTRSAIIMSGVAASGVLFPPFFLPYVIDRTVFPPGTLLDGDPFQTAITVGPGGPYTIQLILKQNGVIILNSTQIGTFAVFNFSWLFSAVYDFNGTVN